MDASPRADDAPRTSPPNAAPEAAPYRSAQLEVDALRAVLGADPEVPPVPPPRVDAPGTLPDRS